jgi:hypothetical protein
VSISVYFVFERNLSLLLADELDNGHYTLLSVAEKERLGISDEVCLHNQTLPKTFHLYTSSLVLYLNISAAAFPELFKLLRLDISDKACFENPPLKF